MYAWETNGCMRLWDAIDLSAFTLTLNAANKTAWSLAGQRQIEVHLHPAITDTRVTEIGL